MFASEYFPGALYGLTEIHKAHVPSRPTYFLEAVDTPTYALAKHLVPILSPITKIEYTVSKTSKFIVILRGFKNLINFYTNTRTNYYKINY